MHQVFICKEDSLCNLPFVLSKLSHFLLLSESLFITFVFEAEIAVGFSMVQGLGTANPPTLFTSHLYFAEPRET